MSAACVLALGAVLGWTGYREAKRHQHRILQEVSLGLAAHIAKQSDMIHGDTLAADPQLFAHLMAVNPNIEVYLLDDGGRIVQFSEGGAPLAQDRVSLTPIRRLLAGESAPILGDNPRHAGHSEIFSVAAISGPDGDRGYVYIVLLNAMYRGMVTDAWRDYLLRSGVWLFGLTISVALIAGVFAFFCITRRLRGATREVDAYANDNPAVFDPQDGRSDEIERLTRAFAAMRWRLDAQMRELTRQDELRRELVANISHDLRTPLTSMQGYLEALLRMEDAFDRDERRRYLEVAVRQSVKVSRLAQQLFELAKLECEETLPQTERFSISELVQDIAQKFALSASEKRIRLDTRVENEALFVEGDIGMIERVVTNLIENAIRHTPEHGEVRLEARSHAGEVEIMIADTGHGIPEEQMPGLLERGSTIRRMAARRGGGLGLLIANRILDLHGSAIRAASRVGEGTRISFVLPRVRTV
ncbi:MAG: HAMP domain-containing histidine kinase [Lysobacter sp.]|nr:HAMP domain-containing histidine kinase [Lysobacter sp.]